MKCMISMAFNQAQIENVELVVFDKDGTLIDIHNYWSSMLKLRSREIVTSFDFDEPEKIFGELIEAMGVNLGANTIKSEGPVGIKPRSFIEETAYLVASKYNASFTLEKAKEIFARVDKTSQSFLADFIRPLPGVKNFLCKLKEKNVKLAIATTDLSSRAVLAMNTIGLGEFFDLIAGGDCVKKSKPAPDIMNFIIEKIPVSRKNIVLIGDSIVDLELANNSRINFLGVKTGLFNSEFIERSLILVDNLSMIEVV